MPNLSQVELQNLRHLIGAHETSYQKVYPEIKLTI